MQSQPWKTCRISYWNTQNSSAAPALNHPLSCHCFGELLRDTYPFSGNRWVKLSGCTDDHFLSRNPLHPSVGELICSCQGPLCLTGFSCPQKCYFWSKCPSPPTYMLIFPCSPYGAITSKVRYQFVLHRVCFRELPQIIASFSHIPLHCLVCSLSCLICSWVLWQHFCIS